MSDTIIKIGFLFTGTVLAFGIWALKNLIMSRTKIRRGTDIPIQLGEFKAMCKDNMDIASENADLKFITDEKLELFCEKRTAMLRQGFKSDLNHAVVLINQQLNQGHKKFEDLEISVGDAIKCVNQMKGSVDTLIKVVKENGNSKPNL